MELGIPIALLLGYAGYNVSKTNNGKKVERGKKDLRTDVSDFNIPSYTNTYKSTFSRQNDMDEQKIADIRYELAKNPQVTNIIPPLYNTMCHDNNCDYSKPKKPVTQSILPQIQSQQNDNNRGLNTFNPPVKISEESNQMKLMPFETNEFSLILGTPVDYYNPQENEKINGVGSNDRVDRGDRVNTTENFGNILVSKLSGLPIDTDTINMVPHFGSTMKQTMDTDNPHKKLENYTGFSNKDNKKKEVVSMFEPEKKNVFGNHEIRDRSRQIQSNTKNGMLPFSQTQVAPIPAAALRPQYRTQEERNVNPRQVNRTADPIMGTMPSAQQRGIIGQVSKNRVDRTWDTDIDRLIGVKGATTANRSIENYTNKSSNLLAEEQYPLGIAKGINTSSTTRMCNNENNCDPLTSIYKNVSKQAEKPSLHINMRNTVGQNKPNDIDRQRYTANENERDTTSKMIFMPASGHKATYEGYTDKSKATIKQSNLFSYTGNQSAMNKPMDYQTDYSHTRIPAKVIPENYIGNVKIGSKGVNREEYENMEIKSGREVIADLQNYIHQIGTSSKIPAGACSVNFKGRDDSKGKSAFDGFNYFDIKNTNIPDVCHYGDNKTFSSKEHIEEDYKYRIDPSLYTPINNNPYNIQYNPV